MKKTKRKPASIQCPFCLFKAESWFLRERLDDIAWHIEEKHYDKAICPFCERRPMSLSRHLATYCILGGFGAPLRIYKYGDILTAMHAKFVGVEP